MTLKNSDLTLLTVIKREGISKQGLPYLFYQGRFLDDEGNVCELKFAKSVVDDSPLISKLMTVKNKPVTIDVSIYKSGFNLKGTVSKIEI